MNKWLLNSKGSFKAIDQKKILKYLCSSGHWVIQGSTLKRLEFSGGFQPIFDSRNNFYISFLSQYPIFLSHILEIIIYWTKVNSVCLLLHSIKWTFIQTLWVTPRFPVKWFSLDCSWYSFTGENEDLILFCQYYLLYVY